MATSGASSVRRHVLAALGLAALGHIAYIHTLDAPKPVYHCPLDSDGLAHHWADENCYWSSSYAEAREKFVALGNRLREQVHQSRNEGALKVLVAQSMQYDIGAEDFATHIKSLQGNDVEPQTIFPGSNTVDALLLTIRGKGKGDGENVDIIHSSGTHGVEGYLGSAVQLRFLHELFLENQNLHRSPDNSGRVRKILLIHSVNPYGMRHHRRTNENNVDLNRNVLDDETWSEVLKRDPNYVGAVDGDWTLNPFVPINEEGELFSWADAARRGGFEGDTTRLERRDEEVAKAASGGDNGAKKNALALLDERPNEVVAWLEEKKTILMVTASVLYQIAVQGFVNGKRMLVSPQYHKPSGISYGGFKLENSILAVQHAINEFAAFDAEKDRVLWIDVHTGLGRFGDYTTLMKGNWGKGMSDEGSRDSDAKHAWIATFQSRLAAAGMGQGASYDPGVSAGYDASIGFVTDAVLCPPPMCLGLNQEFGTRPGAAMAVALIVENSGFNSPPRRYGALTSWAFYPKRLSWRRKTLRGGMEMLRAALDF
ncbi:hypothetical protein ACHAXT_004205 [Thalassiosira profunda]